MELLNLRRLIYSLPTQPRKPERPCESRMVFVPNAQAIKVFHLWKWMSLMPRDVPINLPSQPLLPCLENPMYSMPVFTEDRIGEGGSGVFIIYPKSNIPWAEYLIGQPHHPPRIVSHIVRSIFTVLDGMAVLHKHNIVFMRWKRPCFSVDVDVELVQFDEAHLMFPANYGAAEVWETTYVPWEQYCGKQTFDAGFSQYSADVLLFDAFTQEYCTTYRAHAQALWSRSFENKDLIAADLFGCSVFLCKLVRMWNEIHPIPCAARIFVSLAKNIHPDPSRRISAETMAKEVRDHIDYETNWETVRDISPSAVAAFLASVARVVC